MTHILGVDIGTTGMKMGVFRQTAGTLTLAGDFSRTYEIHTYNKGLFSDIEPHKWQEAFIAGCRHLAALRNNQGGRKFDSPACHCKLTEFGRLGHRRSHEKIR